MFHSIIPMLNKLEFVKMPDSNEWRIKIDYSPIFGEWVTKDAYFTPSLDFVDHFNLTSEQDCRDALLFELNEYEEEEYCERRVHKIGEDFYYVHKICPEIVYEKMLTGGCPFLNLKICGVEELVYLDNRMQFDNITEFVDYYEDACKKHPYHYYGDRRGYDLSDYEEIDEDYDETDLENE